MSITYSLVCDDCKVEYWCGQSLHIYSKEKTADFLNAHIGHALRFVDNCNDESIENYSDFEAIEEDKELGQ
jgi:hypothetical protein